MVSANLPAASSLTLVNRAWMFRKGRRQEGIKPSGRVTSNSGNALVQAAVDGLGIATVPACYGRETLADGRLVRVLEDWASVETSDFHLVFPAGRHMPVRVRKFIDYLQAAAQGLVV